MSLEIKSRLIRYDENMTRRRNLLGCGLENIFFAANSVRFQILALQQAENL